MVENPLATVVGAASHHGEVSWFVKGTSFEVLAMIGIGVGKAVPTVQMKFIAGGTSIPMGVAVVVGVVPGVGVGTGGGEAVGAGVGGA